MFAAHLDLVEERETEAERIFAWRLEELVRAGYAEEPAAELAERRDVDLHTAVGLVRRGCPHDTAVRILR